MLQTGDVLQCTLDITDFGRRAKKSTILEIYYIETHLYGKRNMLIVSAGMWKKSRPRGLLYRQYRNNRGKVHYIESKTVKESIYRKYTENATII